MLKLFGSVWLENLRNDMNSELIPAKSLARACCEEETRMERAELNGLFVVYQRGWCAKAAL